MKELGFEPKKSGSLIPVLTMGQYHYFRKYKAQYACKKYLNKSQFVESFSLRVKIYLVPLPSLCLKFLLKPGLFCILSERGNSVLTQTTYSIFEWH